jgi:hypothetical protein
MVHHLEKEIALLIVLLIILNYVRFGKKRFVIESRKTLTQSDAGAPLEALPQGYAEGKPESRV